MYLVGCIANIPRIDTCQASEDFEKTNDVKKLRKGGEVGYKESRWPSSSFENNKYKII